MNSCARLCRSFVVPDAKKFGIQKKDKLTSIFPRSNRSRMMSLQLIMFVFFIDLAPVVWSWTAKVAPREKQWTDDFSHLTGTIRMIQNHPDAPPYDLHNNSLPREPADSDQTPKSCSSVIGFLLKCSRILQPRYRTDETVIGGQASSFRQNPRQESRALTRMRGDRSNPISYRDKSGFQKSLFPQPTWLFALPLTSGLPSDIMSAQERHSLDGGRA